jgi:hypothetical protein
MAIHDMWCFDHAPQSTTDLSSGAAPPVYSETGTYNTYTGNPGYLFKNTSGVGAVGTDGYLSLNSSSTSNPGLAIQAKEVQDWSVATQYWVGFRTKTSAQNAAGANVFTMSDTIAQANPTVMITESDMTAAVANVANTEYYVEVFIDRVNRIYKVYIAGVPVKSGTINAATIVSGGNGFYWFGAYNSALSSGAVRGFRDVYWLDVDSVDTTRLGSVRSSLAPLAAVSAPNYTPLGFNGTLSGTAAISTTQSKFGGASLNLGATTSSALTVPETAALHLLSDCTIEAWVYLTSTSGNQAVFGKAANSSTPYSHLTYNGGTWYAYMTAPSTTGTIQVASKMSVNTWFHIALVRQGGTWYLFENGVLLGSVASTNTFGDNTGAFTIGNWGGLTNQWTGYIDEFRISNIARYNAAFTPPTATFTPDANTVLLMHMDSATSGVVSDAANNAPFATLAAPYPNPPTGPGSTTSAVTDDTLVSTFTASAAAAAAPRIVAVDYRIAAQSTSLANLNVALKNGGTTLNEPAYTFPDTATMKYGRRVLLTRTGADGAAWTAAKVSATQLLLTPTN